MPVLFAVSILAFVALLWATISIAGFVRRQRRRRRRREGNAADATFRDIPAKSAEPASLFYRDPEAAEQAWPQRGEAPPQPRINNEPPPPAETAPRETSATTIVEPPAEQIAVPVNTAAAGLPPPPRLRSFPTRLGKQPASATDADIARSAWNPFSEDFADLSDPVASRHSPRPRARNKDGR